MQETAPSLFRPPQLPIITQHATGLLKAEKCGWQLIINGPGPLPLASSTPAATAAAMGPPVQFDRREYYQMAKQQVFCEETQRLKESSSLLL